MLEWRGVNAADLDAQFRDDVSKLLGESPHVWRVTSGYRTMKEQEALYAKYLAGGPKAAPPGKSAHNFRVAIDVVPDGSPAPGFQPDWQPEPGDAWYWLREQVDAHPRLRGGWHFNDWCHLQVYPFSFENYGEAVAPIPVAPPAVFQAPKRKRK